MKQVDYLRKVCLSFPEATEEPHFEKTSFRVTKKIFVTYDASANRASLKLSEADQDLLSLFDSNAIYPVPNKWGKKGWTFIELDRLTDQVLKDALTSAYCEVAPMKLRESIKDN
ncbi:MAG TPA: MmcQ/YjbR family DNA-binding protein [Lunatimonas sp.]|nr:MmcQ/YjbR family DNA-binding protein [Lunatimonas sp.]